MKLAFALVIFLALLPTADAFFFDAIFTFFCWLSGGLFFGTYCGNGADSSSTGSPTKAPTPSPVVASPGAPTAAPVSSGPAPDALKIKEDSFGVAAKFKDILNPYIPVELVSEGAEFNLAFDLKQGTDISVDTSGIDAFCEPGGYTISADIDQTNQASYDNTVKNFLRFVLEDWGIEKQDACDAGYYYSDLPEISKCSANQLSALDKCFKGRQEANPTSWSPPDTTPQPGQAIVKVKVLVTSALVAENWTKADTEKKIERANRLVASCEGLTEQIRFTLYDQQTVEAADFGTNADDTSLTNTRNFGENDDEKSNYDVIMYLFKEKPTTGSVVGKADNGLCFGVPTAVVANVYANLVVPHELMHTVRQYERSFHLFIADTRSPNVYPSCYLQLGAIHDPSTCNDYIIDIDLGMGACNVKIMQSAIPTYTCLSVAE